MTCMVSIAGGIAYRSSGSQIVERFQVFGVAVDCEALDIQLSFGDPVQSVSGTAEVSATGGWHAEIDLSAHALPCGDGTVAIDVVAACADDPSCSDATKYQNYSCQVFDTCPLFDKIEALPVTDDGVGCNALSQRSVQLSATLQAPVPSGLPVIAQFCLVSLETGEVTNTGAGTLQPAVPFTASEEVLGGLYRYELKILSPAPCAGPLGIVLVPACVDEEDAPAVCPTINFESPVIAQECTDDNLRQVDVSVEIVPEPGHPVSATLEIRRDGGLTSSLAAMAETTDPTTLSGSLPLPAGDYDLAVNLSAPDSCSDATVGFTVAKCPVAIGGGDPGGDPTPTPDPDPGGDPTPTPTPDPDGGTIGINGCLIGLWVGLAFFLIGALGTGIGFCLVGLIGVWVNPIWVAVWTIIINISVVLLMIGTLVLTIWVFLCGSCRINCEMLKFARDLFVVYIGPAVTVLAAIGVVGIIGALSPLCWAGWAIDMLASVWMAALLQFWVGFTGCETWSEQWPSWLRPTMPDWMRMHCGVDEGGN